VDTFLLLLPELALIATGAVLMRVLPLGDGAWAAIEKLIYMVLFPPLIFLSIARQPLDQLQAGPYALGVFLVLLLGIVLGGLGGRLTGTGAPRFASGVQCAFRFNGYLAIALSQRLGGDAGLALCGVMVAIAVPVGNFAAVAYLARGAGQSVWREVARNPLVLAAVAGLAASAAGVSGVSVTPGLCLDRAGTDRGGCGSAPVGFARQHGLCGLGDSGEADRDARLRIVDRACAGAFPPGYADPHGVCGGAHRQQRLHSGRPHGWRRAVYRAPDHHHHRRSSPGDPVLDQPGPPGGELSRALRSCCSSAQRT